jgi:hypothetical protein
VAAVVCCIRILFYRFRLSDQRQPTSKNTLLEALRTDLGQLLYQFMELANHRQRQNTDGWIMDDVRRKLSASTTLTRGSEHILGLLSLLCSVPYLNGVSDFFGLEIPVS